VGLAARLRYKDLRFHINDTSTKQAGNRKGDSMRRIVPTLFLLAAVGFSVALAGELAGAAEARPQWQQKWDNVVEAAKKEGRVVLATNQAFQVVFAEFQKTYPEIKVVSTSSGGGEQVSRIVSERRAGKYLEDVVTSGAPAMYNMLYKRNALDPIKPALILPEVLDESKWWKGKHLYMDEEERYIFAFNLVPLLSFAYNTKLVDPKEIKSYWDFLDPKWKGKILLLDPTSPFGTAPLQFLYYHPQLGPEFIRRLLSEMDVTASRDTRQIADWLATGKFAISGLTVVSRTRLDKAKKQGLPVDWFDAGHFKEGVALHSAPANIGLLNRAPHPNAARVLINWLLSREGQIAYQKASDDRDSLRIDIPKDDAASYARRVEGVKYHLLDERIDLAPVMKFVSEVWKRKN
jgi:ABC-type Fe3+ transport system substrate-binding protein